MHIEQTNNETLLTCILRTKGRCLQTESLDLDQVYDLSKSQADFCANLLIDLDKNSIFYDDILRLSKKWALATRYIKKHMEQEIV